MKIRTVLDQIDMASKAGFRFFTTVQEFKNYVLDEIIAEETAV